MSGYRVEIEGRIAYVGNGAGKPDANAESVVFIHGAGMDHTVWALPARHFARKGFRVLAVDLPGHGRSQGPPLPSIEDMADWLAEVLRIFDVETASVAGHSMGSLAAWELASRHGAACSRLALFGTSWPMPVTATLLDAAADNHHAAIDMANQWSHGPGSKLGANANPGVWMLGSGERLLERAAPGVFHADLTACNNYPPQQSAAQSVDCPVLVVVGEADQMTPARAGLAVAASLPNAQVVRLPNCGHSLLSERPNDVLDALVQAFIR